MWNINFQNLLLLFVFLYALIGLLYGVKHRLKSYWQSPPFFLLGAFIYGDILPLSIFWIAVSIICFALQDILLFYLILSLFWLVRSVGETIYWFHQQFTPRKWELEHFVRLPFYNIVKEDSIWIIYQVICQCITVITIITSVKLFVIWLAK